MNTATSDSTDVEYATDDVGEQRWREYDTDVKLAGRMHVTRMNTAGLENLQMNLTGLPKGLYLKNSRQPSNAGQVHVGWTSFNGPQTQAICGVQCPYLSSSYKYLANNQPALLAQLLGVAETMWNAATTIFPVETSTMLQTSACFRLGTTGFQKISSGTNLAALWHKDDGNLAGSIQCVLMLGVFEGGHVRFDLAGRLGKNRSPNTKSQGREEDVVVVPNEHGTLFIGHYESVWHSVDSVTDGDRTIVAAYATKAVQTFDRAAIQSGRYTFEQAMALQAYRVDQVKALRVEQDKVVRGAQRKALTDMWRQQDGGNFPG